MVSKQLCLLSSDAWHQLSLQQPLPEHFHHAAALLCLLFFSNSTPTGALLAPMSFLLSIKHWAASATLEQRTAKQ